MTKAELKWNTQFEFRTHMFPIQSTYVREAEPFRILLSGPTPSLKTKTILGDISLRAGVLWGFNPLKARAWDPICDNAFATPSGNVKKRRAQLKSSKKRAGVGRETRVGIRSGTIEWVVRDVWNMCKWSSECKCEARRYMAASHPAEWCGYYAKWPDWGQRHRRDDWILPSLPRKYTCTWAGRVVHVAWLNTTLCVRLRGVKLQMITTIESRSHVVSGCVKCYNN